MAASFKPCAKCSSPAKCKSAGKCMMKHGAKEEKAEMKGGKYRGGMKEEKAEMYKKGGMVKKGK